MDENNQKQTKTRFHYAVGSTLATFIYLAVATTPDAGAAFMFLSVVAGGFGVSKATEHLQTKKG